MGVYIAVKEVEGRELPANLGLEQLCNFWVLQFFKVKADTRALGTALHFQPQLDGCHYKVVDTADVSAWESSCVRLVDAGFEALWCQDESKQTDIRQLGLFALPGPLQHLPGENHAGDPP